MLHVPQRPKTLLVGRLFVKRFDRKLLIMRRSLEDVNNPGKWEVPGGKANGGQLIEEAQKRETYEETGLRVRLTHQNVCSYSYPIEGGRTYRVEFAIAQPMVDGQEVKLSHEHSDYQWVSYQKMFDYDLTKEVRSAARAAKRQLLFMIK